MPIYHRILLVAIVLCWNCLYSKNKSARMQLTTSCLSIGNFKSLTMTEKINAGSVKAKQGHATMIANMTHTREKTMKLCGSPPGGVVITVC